MSHRLTAKAERDIETILRDTLTLFGPRQVRTYAALIDQAIALVASDPDLVSSRPRPLLGKGVRSLHLDVASGRIGSGSHIVFYAAVGRRSDTTQIAILRILHERMDPATRVTSVKRPRAIRPR